MRTTSVSFGRAFTSTEMKQWEKIQEEAKKALGLKETSMICFDSCMPEAENEDRGIGTSFSDSATKFVDFMSKMTGANTIQLEPQGRLAQGTNSPFSGTVFSLGEHLIDLKKLTTDRYEHILPYENYEDAISFNKEYAEFENVLDKNRNNMKAMQIAHENFKELPKTSPLKKEFSAFVNENKDWLEKEAMFDCLAEEHQDGNWKNWPAKDKYLYTSKINHKVTNARINEIKKKHKDKYDFVLFTQFIADKQQTESKKALNAKGIKLSGDCLIGFSEKEHWGNQDAFYENGALGCEDRHYDKNQGKEVVDLICWGMPALDFDKIGTFAKPGPAGKLFCQKFEKFFKRYDSLRIDAAWQLVKPCILKYDSETNEFEKIKIPEQGDKLLKIIDQVLKKTRPNDYKNCSVNLELLGCDIYKDPIFKNRVQIHHSIYQHDEKDGWGSVEAYRKMGLGEDNITFGTGTHDDSTMSQIFYDNEKNPKQTAALSKHLKMDQERLRTDLEYFTRAKFGEIFTTKNNFFTVFDAMGCNKRINDQTGGDHNWRARVTLNYEDRYFRNLAEGKGLNLPAAYLVALNAKNIHNPNLQAKLEKAKRILKEEGPYTTESVNETIGANYSSIE